MEKELLGEEVMPALPQSAEPHRAGRAGHCVQVLMDGRTVASHGGTGGGWVRVSGGLGALRRERSEQGAAPLQRCRPPATSPAPAEKPGVGVPGSRSSHPGTGRRSPRGGDWGSAGHVCSKNRKTAAEPRVYFYVPLTGEECVKFQ